MADEQRDMSSLLGQGSDFKGKLTFFGTVRIEGRIEGDIFSDDTLVVAPGGFVQGTVHVGTLIITGGTVEAKVEAQKAVEIHPGGVLRGEVVAPLFEVARGAVFRGTCSMPDPVPEEQAETATSE